MLVTSRAIMGFDGDLKNGGAGFKKDLAKAIENSTDNPDLRKNGDAAVDYVLSPQARSYMNAQAKQVDTQTVSTGKPRSNDVDVKI